MVFKTIESKEMITCTSCFLYLVPLPLPPFSMPNSMACLFDYVEWDADLATEAYRQQVEALAHHQVGESSGAT